MSTLPQVISTNLTSQSDVNIYQYGLTLLSGIPLVPAYKEIKPSLDEGGKIIRDFGTAVANAAKGGEAVMKQRDELRPQVIDIIQQWSAYATQATPDDVVAWSTAHFRLTKGTRTPRGPLAAPTKFVVADGPAKGSVELRQNPQAGTKAYLYEYALVPADGQAPQWHYCLGTTGSCIVTGLVSGRQYMFRVAAWNGTGETAYSPAETRYVQ